MLIWKSCGRVFMFICRWCTHLNWFWSGCYYMWVIVWNLNDHFICDTIFYLSNHRSMRLLWCQTITHNRRRIIVSVAVHCHIWINEFFRRCRYCCCYVVESPRDAPFFLCCCCCCGNCLKYVNQQIAFWSVVKAERKKWEMKSKWILTL